MTIITDKVLGGKDMIIHISVQEVYKFEGWYFEYSRTKPFGPWPLKQDGAPRARAGNRFYEMLGSFLKLSVDEQERFAA